MMRLVALLALVMLPGTPVAAEEEAVSFSQRILPMLMKECAYCHMREERYGYLVIDPETAYANLVGVPARGYPAMRRVEPGAPDISYLWMKLTGRHLELGAKGWPMPFFPLQDADMQAIRSWIEQGAHDN